MILPLALLGLAVAAGATEPPLQEVARQLVGADQGVFAHAEDGTVLAALNPDRPLHPASVTKVATSLALLGQLGPAHRFETRFAVAGRLADGTLAGDLVVEAGGDPVLVSENALLVVHALRARGLETVAGGLRVEGSLLFNWKPDPAGRVLGRLLAGRDGESAWAALRAARPEVGVDGPNAPGLRFDGRRDSARGGSPRVLVVHRSAPLARVVKALNCYSNNVLHVVSGHVGGPHAVERSARASVAPELRAAIVIDDAAGLGTTNRMSPRAAAALVDALARELEPHGLTLLDALPVAGIDPGTLRERLAGGAVVGKTGTIASLGVSALAGRARTRRWGEVTFAVLDRGLPVPEAQRRQDAFVRALLAEGGAVPWPYGGDGRAIFAEAEVRSESPESP